MTFTMTGRLSQCILLAYRTPVSSVSRLVPRGLELVTRGDWAFWNIVACRIDGMRPAGAPRLLGVSYHHVAYRLYVRAAIAGGQIIEGLYFVRSDADHCLMAKAGNLLTDFCFHPAKIALTANESRLTLSVQNSPGGAGNARLSVELNGEPIAYPDSCFDSPDEAGRFLKYRPFGLSRDAKGTWLKVAEVLRDESEWNEMPLRVTDAEWSFFESLNQRDVRLEHATCVAPIAYRWRLGRREKPAKV